MEKCVLVKYFEVQRKQEFCPNTGHYYSSSYAHVKADDLIIFLIKMLTEEIFSLDIVIIITKISRNCCIA